MIATKAMSVGNNRRRNIRRTRMLPTKKREAVCLPYRGTVKHLWEKRHGGQLCQVLNNREFE